MMRVRTGIIGNKIMTNMYMFCPLDEVGLAPSMFSIHLYNKEVISITYLIRCNMILTKLIAKDELLLVATDVVEDPSSINIVLVSCITC